MTQHTAADGARRTPGIPQNVRARLAARLNLRVMAIVAAAALIGITTFAWGTTRTNAANGRQYVAAVTFPFNGVWLDSLDAPGGHY